jgi:peptide deformylase
VKGLIMASREIIKSPSGDALRKKAKSIGRVDDKVMRVFADMTETLRESGGNGLAAPQIGVMLRLIIVKNELEYIKLANPVIVKSAGEQLSLEGCLSLPGVYAMVKRPEYVLIRALGSSGKLIELKALHRLTAALAHEIDHLDGILMIDKAIRIVNYKK